MAAVLHHSRAKGTAKLVLVGIANHAGDGGAWPSVETLARYGNVHERNVQRALEKLEQLGEVEVHLQAGGTLFSHKSDWLRPNRYDVTVTCPTGCDRTANHRPIKGWERTTDGTYRPLSTGVADTPPGGDSATRPGGDSATQTVHPTTDTTGSRAVTGSREAHGHTPPCTECAARDLYECTARQAKLRPEDRHTYNPRAEQ